LKESTTVVTHQPNPNPPTHEFPR